MERTSGYGSIDIQEVLKMDDSTSHNMNLYNSNKVINSAASQSSKTDNYNYNCLYDLPEVRYYFLQP